MGAKTSIAAVCTTRSLTVEMPSGRCLPSGLGIHTRRTACGRYVLLLNSCVSSPNHRQRSPIQSIKSLATEHWPVRGQSTSHAKGRDVWHVTCEVVHLFLSGKGRGRVSVAYEPISLRNGRSRPLPACSAGRSSHGTRAGYNGRPAQHDSHTCKGNRTCQRKHQPA